MNPVLRILLRPGIALMRRLRLPAKVFLIGSMLFVPLVVVLVNSLQQGLAEVSAVRAELRGADLARRMMDVAGLLQTHRGLTHRVLNGDAAAAARLDATRQRLAQTLASIDATEGWAQEMSLVEHWPATREAIAALAKGEHDRQRDRAFDQHSEQVEALRANLLLVAERSGLLLDPEAHTYTLMDLAIQHMLPWTESIGVLNGQAAGLLARGEASGAERAKVLGRVNQLRRGLVDVDRRMAALQRTGEARPAGYEEAMAASRAFADKAAAVFSADAVEGEPGPFFNQGAAAGDAAAAVGRFVTLRLGEALEQRAQTLTRKMML